VGKEVQPRYNSTGSAVFETPAIPYTAFRVGGENWPLIKRSQTEGEAIDFAERIDQ
jgi:hypothetical protein